MEVCIQHPEPYLAQTFIHDPLFFRPSGNLIVSSQRLPHRHDIVFLERNGLRHGEFTLREKTNHKLLEVSWNADSTMLAVWLEAENAAGKCQKTGKLDQRIKIIITHIVFISTTLDIEQLLLVHEAAFGIRQ